MQDHDISEGGDPSGIRPPGAETEADERYQQGEQDGDSDELTRAPQRRIGQGGLRFTHAVQGSIGIMHSPEYRISQGVIDAPPPPLAGALAAWLWRKGRSVRIVDPRGEEADWNGDGPLWVHLDAGFTAQRLALVKDGADLHFFGPALAQGQCRTDLEQRYPCATLIAGDPEAQDAPLDDLSVLPLTSYAGFGAQPGGLFRMLAGRGERARPIALLCREIVYLVETFGAGHLLFDDDDLDRYLGWLDAFSAELRALPWPLTFEATVSGQRQQFCGRTAFVSPLI